MELKETITLMNSSDYKERFIAEYFQTKIRYEKLKTFNNKIEAGFRIERNSNNLFEVPVHNCPYDLLKEQQEAMGHYLHVLEIRAVIENVDLKGGK